MFLGSGEKIEITEENIKMFLRAFDLFIIVLEYENIMLYLHSAISINSPSAWITPFRVT